LERGKEFKIDLFSRKGGGNAEKVYRGGESSQKKSEKLKMKKKSPRGKKGDYISSPFPQEGCEKTSPAREHRNL